MTRPRRPSTTVVDWAVVIVLMAIFFAGSARHVYALATEHGQDRWGALLIVGSVEVLAGWSGWEIRRRSDAWRVVPMLSAAGCVAFVVSANWASASSGDLWSQIIAVTPAACLVMLALTLETRAGRRPVSRRRPRAEKPPAPAEPPVAAPVRSAPDPAEPVAEKPPVPAQRRQRDVSEQDRALVELEFRERLGGENPMTAQEIAARLDVKLRQGYNLVRRWTPTEQEVPA